MQCCVEYAVTLDSAIKHCTAMLLELPSLEYIFFQLRPMFHFDIQLTTNGLKLPYLNCLCPWCRFRFRRQPYSMNEKPSIAQNGSSVRLFSFCSFVYLSYFRILFNIDMVFLSETGPLQWVFGQDRRYRWPYDLATGHQGPVSRERRSFYVWWFALQGYDCLHPILSIYCDSLWW